MKKIAIVCSHPIQYYAPLFRVLAVDLSLKVFYCHNPSKTEIGKDGFGKAFSWDVDLLKGYDYEFLENVSSQPSVSNFNGCDTPGIGKAIASFQATHVVVFGWYLKSFKQALRYCKKYGVPIAVRGDSQLNPLLPLWKRIVKKLYYPFFLNQYDAFLYVGSRNKDYLRFYGVKEKKLIFSPHAVDQEFWTGKKKQNDVFTFVWVAKFIDKKRPLDLIRAIKCLNVQDFHLKMIGSGALLEEAKNLAGEDERIHFLGFKNQTELRTEFLSCDAIVLCSNFEETWGLVINEAFSNYIPAVVADQCGCSVDLIEEGKTGFKFQTSDIRELAEALGKALRLKQDQKVVSAIQEKNRVYSYERNIQSFQEFISKQWR